MWKLVLCVSVSLWGGVCAREESFLSGIGRSLRAEMAGVLELAVVNYSTPVFNTTYVAGLEFDMRAMGAVYNATHRVIDAIVHKQAYPEGVLVVSDGHPELSRPLREQWRVLAAHYAGPASVVTVAALLAAALPIAGLLWCCCHWCRAGRRRRPFDRKYDECIKGLLGVALIALLTLFLFGLVVAFATDAAVQEGCEGSGEAVRAGLRDVRAFLNETASHAHWLLVTNYGELERRLDALLTSSGLTISVQLGEFSRAVSVTTLTGVVRSLDGVQEDLRSVRRLTMQLRADAEALNAELRAVKGQLLQALKACDQPPCLRLQEKHKIGQLDTEIHYSQMPDVTELLNNVTLVLESDIKAEVEEGQKVFRDVQLEIQRSVDRHLPQVQEAVREAGVRLAEVSARAGRLCAAAGERVTAAERAADAIDGAYARWGVWRKLSGRVASAALLVCVMLLVWGMLCGVCGKRPDAYGAADCCNKGQGSRCLLCGVAMLFLSTAVACLVLVVYFVAGVAAQRFVCDPLTEPRGNRLFSDLEKFVDLEKALFNERADPDFNMTYVMMRCHDNRTVYETFQLSRLYDLDRLAEDLSGQVSSRASALSPRYERAQPITILRPSARDKLLQLARTGLSDFDFDRIVDALETNMTSLSLDGLAGQLESASRSLVDRPAYREVSLSLRDAGERLRRAHTVTVHNMLSATAELNVTALRLRAALRFNHTSLQEAVTYLLHETEQAERFLNTQGPALVGNMTREFAGVVAALLDEYLARVVSAARHDVGRCGPLSRAYNATRDAHCRKILMPVNGYWMSLSWCVLLFVPLVVVAQRLARLHRNLEPYPGPVVEAEYLYDAYADRDNVPLANAYKAEKRAGRGGGGGGSRAGVAVASGGAAGTQGGAEPAGGARTDLHHARRYNDMAPKHWEEGPPRYHGPTEYERPPPYYYPGPLDRQ